MSERPPDPAADPPTDTPDSPTRPDREPGGAGPDGGGGSGGGGEKPTTEMPKETDHVHVPPEGWNSSRERFNEAGQKTETINFHDTAPSGENPSGETSKPEGENAPAPVAGAGGDSQKKAPDNTRERPDGPDKGHDPFSRPFGQATPRSMSLPDGAMHILSIGGSFSVSLAFVGLVQVQFGGFAAFDPANGNLFTGYSYGGSDLLETFSGPHGPDDGQDKVRGGLTPSASVDFGYAHGPLAAMRGQSKSYGYGFGIIGVSSSSDDITGSHSGTFSIGLGLGLGPTVSESTTEISLTGHRNISLSQDPGLDPERELLRWVGVHAIWPFDAPR